MHPAEQAIQVSYTSGSLQINGFDEILHLHEDMYQVCASHRERLHVHIYSHGPALVR